jgi:hypothetical protein
MRMHWSSLQLFCSMSFPCNWREGDESKTEDASSSNSDSDTLELGDSQLKCIFFLLPFKFAKQLTQTRETKDLSAYSSPKFIAPLHDHIDSAAAVITTLALTTAVWAQV